MTVRGAQGQLSLSLEPQRRIFQVHELNAAVQEIFEVDFRGILVAGEISGCRTAASGHYYFSLKDSESQVKCALFKGTARFVRCKPQDGLAVIARGSLEVYQARGEYQLIVESIEPQGAGVLQLAFEQLKKMLAAEGLFAAERKRPLPALPRRIGIVTSPSGAVIRDMLHVLERRFPGLQIRLFPSQVQGDGAVEQVCAGLRFFSQTDWAEVVILARGGGSLEDLWTFNEEAVARSIAASRAPVISAIGHETDFTISDFVADHRAPTPSAAAEIVICTRESLLEQLSACRQKAGQAVRYLVLVASRDLQQQGVDRAARLMQRRLTAASQQTDELDDRLQRWQRSFLDARRRRYLALEQRLQNTNLQLRFSRIRHQSELLTQRLTRTLQDSLARRRVRYDSLLLHLRQISPLTVLERGYAIVENHGGQVVRAAAETQPGEELKVRLHQGHLQVSVLPE